MMNNAEKKLQYSWVTCLFLALFGFAFLAGFVTELYQIIYGERLSVMLTLFLGYFSYLFLYTAYKGKSPKWFNDRDIFGSNTKEHESK
jgi:type IV secretory pathway TrbL component